MLCGVSCYVLAKEKVYVLIIREISNSGVKM